MLCHESRTVSLNVVEIKDTENIKNFKTTDNGFNPVVLTLDQYYSMRRLWNTFVDFYNKRVYMFDHILSSQDISLSNTDNIQIPNCNPTSTNEIIHPKLVSNKMGKNILKRIARNINSTIADTKSTNVPGQILSSVSMIQNQTEPKLNVSTTIMSIIINTTEKLIASSATTPVNKFNTHMKPDNVSINQDSKENIFLPFSSNQSNFLLLLIMFISIIIFIFYSDLFL